MKTVRNLPEDDAEAVKWYPTAAKQGHAGAQSNLGVKYVSGQGVPEDCVRANALYNLAAAQGYEPAVKARDNLRERMTRQANRKRGPETRQYLLSASEGEGGSPDRLTDCPRVAAARCRLIGPLEGQ